MAIGFRMMGYIFIGGALGSMARYLIFELSNSTFENKIAELITLSVVNIAGAYFLGLVNKHPYFQSVFCKNIWAVGFAGGFTTMSGITVFMAMEDLDVWVWLMLGIGFIAYLIGLRNGRNIAKREAQQELS